MLAHLSAFVGLILPVLGNVLAPLLIWVSQRGRSPYIEENAREALNFNICVVIGYGVCWILAHIYIGILLGLALFFYWLTMTLLAGIRAGEGIHYRYPLTWRLVT